MRTRSIVLVAAVSSALLLAGCGSSGVKKSSGAPESVANLYTNLPGGNGPILAVKIDDTPPAHPQINLDKADIVYIEQVEGGSTRIAAIYANPKTLPEIIGPVRSARISDLEILAQYGHVGFAFSGAQRLFYPKINAANLENLSADHEPPTIYSRDLTRSEPTNMILHPKLLLEKSVAVEKRVIDLPKSPGWKFGSAPTGGVPVNSLSMKWPASRYGAKWSAAQKRWLLEYNGAPDLGTDGIQLGSPTLIIQKVVITPSIYHDKVGGVTPFSQTVGSGTAYLMRDGKAFPIFWNRASEQDTTTWTSKDGKPANFAPGQIWFALTDQEPIFTSPAPTATSSPKK